MTPPLEKIQKQAELLAEASDVMPKSLAEHQEKCKNVALDAQYLLIRDTITLVNERLDGMAVGASPEFKAGYMEAIKDARVRIVGELLKALQNRLITT